MVEKIGPYQIESVLHPGPRRLYKVRAADGRVLALKTIPVEGITPEIRERFSREAAICSTLDHPNLVKVYDSGEADGVLYQAMDLLEGADLGRILADRRPLSWEQKLDIMEQVCEGLQYAHARALVHRDIKPANLFMETSGGVRILDFGMARIESSDLTKVGMAVGTLTYMAPEQIRGEACAPGTDVFAAGVVFYQLAAGRHPFSGEERDLQKILTAILFQTPKPVKELAPDAPDGLDLVLGKALEKNLDRRLRSAADFKQALGLCKITLRLGPPVKAVPPPAEPPRTAAASPAAAPVPPPPIGGPQPAAAKPAEPFDPAKTVVASRAPRPVAPAPPRQPAAAPPPPSSLPKLARKPDTAACPSCTFANPSGATACARCGQPLRAHQIKEPETQTSRLRWAVIALVVVCVLLALLLVSTLVSRNG
ncbi:MAG TPA: protein kinase [Bryobacterales bacterium]|nr:protein kinase [Bryobacterales bacterium]